MPVATSLRRYQAPIGMPAPTSRTIAATTRARRHATTTTTGIFTLIYQPGTVWFDDIAFERLPGGLPVPSTPSIQAQTPTGGDACLEVTWDPKALTAGTIRLLIYCESQAFTTTEGLVPRAFGEADSGKESVGCLTNGTTYYVAAAAVNGDSKVSAAGQPVSAEVRDRQAPRPGWVEAYSSKPGQVHVRWSPHVLDMDVQEALEFFAAHPKIARQLQTLHEVGLDYVRLGQPATTLSGGEAQRVKLAKELSRVATGRTVYILDEPTTGLHFADIQKLLDVLHRLTAAGNTVIVIEHNLDVIKTADYIIDLGPEGGDNGGYIVCEGTPEEVSAHPASQTGKFLAKIL